ncbi:MAG TPA: XRE family transcriptional regulator [Hyphomonas sp.]|nr:XRE family transcriptional regulator [Hyphomonas sp.]
MTAKRYASVWDAIEDSAELAENMRLRADLMVALNKFIATQGMTQAAAAGLFGITQPRVSDLARGKINLFSLDCLVNMAATAGLRIELRVKRAA